MSAVESYPYPVKKDNPTHDSKTQNIASKSDTFSAATVNNPPALL